jgi:hypothetical protein
MARRVIIHDRGFSWGFLGHEPAWRHPAYAACALASGMVPPSVSPTPGGPPAGSNRNQRPAPDFFPDLESGSCPPVTFANRVGPSSPADGPQPRRAIGGLMVAKPPGMGSGGGENWSKGGARRSAQPCSPHNLLADTTRLAGCGGRLGAVLAVAPINQPILSELQAFLGVSL